MNKIIEYEVGRFQGHPVVIRFANVSEEDARSLAEILAKRLQDEFRAIYPVDPPPYTLSDHLDRPYYVTNG